ncbi:hypothetical protein VIGAN_10219800 [Vigna angularis var. angularis]|uniref:Uncharacterized protein n=1 Tax=Vigna angularis var. angularis TaxID=157739 RepID=A0A0S3T6X6_PHAAN|nr:hypothetical protein VIGAN_10219800 [Vigna angularis var. angularis]
MNIIFPRKQGFPGQNFTKYATNRPNVNCRGVLRTIEEQFRGTVPPGDHILRHEIGFRCYPCQTKVSNFKVTVRVQKQITGLKISVQDISRMHILQPP